MSGFNAEMVKPALHDRILPRTVIIGSSMANFGLDPLSPLWRSEDKPVFNFGIDGANIKLQVEVLRHSIAVARPARVIIITSFEDYLPPSDRDDSKKKLDYMSKRLTRQVIMDLDHRLTWLGDRLKILVGYQGLKDSLKTPFTQTLDRYNVVLPEGLCIPGLTEFIYRDVGVHQIYETITRGYAGQMLRAATQQRWPLEDGIGRLIEMSVRSGASVAVVIAPARADLLLLRRKGGAENVAVTWRQKMADLVAATTAATGSGDRVTLWDFEKIGPHSTEPVPPEADTHTRLKWFLDNLHFRPALGEAIIGRIEGTDDSLGVVLTRDNAQEVSAALRAGIDEYEASHPDVSKHLEDEVRSAVKGH